MSVNIFHARHSPDEHWNRRHTGGGFPLYRHVQLIQIAADGGPAERPGLDGTLVAIAGALMQLHFFGEADCAKGHWLLCTTQSDDSLGFAAVIVLGCRATPTATQVVAKFAADDEDIFRVENLIPRFNPTNCRFTNPLPAHVLERWAQWGVLQPFLTQRILVCPKCRAVASFRCGCPQCGSIFTRGNRMIHHFACAHVAPANEFQDPQGLVCPNCRTRHLVVGADCEFLDGPYRCLTCDASDTELALVGQCLGCNLKFPLEVAPEEEVIGYHVNRLHPLDLVSPQ